MDIVTAIVGTLLVNSFDSFYFPFNQLDIRKQTTTQAEIREENIRLESVCDSHLSKFIIYQKSQYFQFNNKYRNSPSNSPWVYSIFTCGKLAIKFKFQSINLEKGTVF